MAHGVKSEKLFDGGGIGEGKGFLGAANDFFQTAEEEDFETKRLGNGGHREIVTCMGGWG